jgi:hypothetical protein
MLPIKAQIEHKLTELSNVIELFKRTINSLSDGDENVGVFEVIHEAMETKLTKLESLATKVKV